MDVSTTKLSFAEQLLLIRRRSGQKQKTVAYLSGVDPSYFASLENARRPPPLPDVLARILDALDASQEDRRLLRQLALSHRLKTQLSQQVSPHVAELMCAIPALSDEQVKAVHAVIRLLTYPDRAVEQEAAM
jgi:transcriptional regulator with XRE-family HTH domain